ncbi:MAG TPA: BON domain-containing protein [Gemmatimonadaceae bacterium]|nr:BON domain-containing protein [Gemmatimonadaceae bacterium]
MSDSQLRKNVVEELEWDPRVGRSEIAVGVKDGVVTLGGQVDSYAKKIAAVRASERVAGVRAVADEVVVDFPFDGQRTDADIAHAAANALRWNADIPKDSVTVSVDKGWVTLDGTAEWQYQKEAADRCVRYLIGVKGVTNAIRLVRRASAVDVQSRIESALKRSAAVDASHITVSVLDSCVTLHGKVRSYAEKLDAENAAWLAQGVTSVDDQIAILV